MFRSYYVMFFSGGGQGTTEVRGLPRIRVVCFAPLASVADLHRAVAAEFGCGLFWWSWQGRALQANTTFADHGIAPDGPPLVARSRASGGGRMDGPAPPMYGNRYKGSSQHTHSGTSASRPARDHLEAAHGCKGRCFTCAGTPGRTCVREDGPGTTQRRIGRVTPPTQDMASVAEDLQELEERESEYVQDLSCGNGTTSSAGCGQHIAPHSHASRARQTTTSTSTRWRGTTIWPSSWMRRIMKAGSSRAPGGHLAAVRTRRTPQRRTRAMQLPLLKCAWRRTWIEVPGRLRRGHTAAMPDRA